MATRCESFLEENPDIKSMFAVSKAMSHIWREMGDNEKLHYQKLAIEDKARYEREIA